MIQILQIIINYIYIYINGSGLSEANHRLDIKYSLLDYKKESVYSSRDTVMFLNLSVTDDILHQGLYASEYIELSNNGYWLYYTKELNDLSNLPSDNEYELTGTVADIRYNINSSNFGGLFDPKYASQYGWGEYMNVIVWYEGFWWERTNNWESYRPGYGAGWKRLTSEYTNPKLADTDQLYSSYQMGDIVVYKENYYRAIQDVNQCDSWFSITNKVFFENLGSISDPIVQKKVKEIGKYSPKSSFTNNDSILKKYLPNDVIMADANHPVINGTLVDIFRTTKIYADGDIVRQPRTISENNEEKEIGYSDLYIKKSNFGTNMKPGTPDSGWIKLDILFDENSSYLKNDCVAFYGSSQYWIQATQDIKIKTEPEETGIGIHDTCLYWKKYK